MYQRGKAPLLPYEQINPGIVEKAVHIAIALVGAERFNEASGYSLTTILDLISGRTTSDRVRTDLLLCARAICQEHKQTFFDLAAIEPTEIPEAVFPIQVTRTVEIDGLYMANRPNPYPIGKIENLLWQAFYMSCRPANSDHIHFYGQPFLRCHGYWMTWPRIEDREWLHQLLTGPMGLVNQNSTVANPTTLDYFARKIGLSHNVWGHALWQNTPDYVAKRVE